MWARICELILAFWILISQFIFSYEGVEIYLNDLWVALMVALFASLSFIQKIGKMHLLEIIPIGWLYYVSFSYPTPFLPFALQNYVIVATLLLMFIIIPSRASNHPKAWEDFLREKNLS